MLYTLAEGVESIGLACSLVLLVPALGAALLGVRRVALIVTWIVATIVVAWMRFVGWWDLAAEGLAHMTTGVVALVIIVAAWRLERLELDLGATILVAAISAWTWVPCVGPELGEILNSARVQPWKQFLGTAAFLVGLYLPLVIVGALMVVAPEIARRIDTPSTRRLGLTVFATIGGLVAVTLFDDLAGELARRSSY